MKDIVVSGIVVVRLIRTNPCVVYFSTDPVTPGEIALGATVSGITYSLPIVDDWLLVLRITHLRTPLYTAKTPWKRTELPID